MFRKKIVLTSLRIALFFAVFISACQSTTSGDDTAPQNDETSPTPVSLISPTSAKQPVIDEVNILLEGLSIDAFFEESYRILLMRDPEMVTELGLSQTFGIRNDRLTDISDAFIRETIAIQRGILELLRGYDRSKLSTSQQISYDVYEWYLEDRIQREEFLYNDYPITHFITGVQIQLIHFFTDIHPITNIDDAEDYIARLALVDEKINQLIEGLRLREEAGIIAPQFIFDWSYGGIRNIAQSSPMRTPFYTTLQDKVIAIEGIDDDSKNDLLTRAEEEIRNSVIPAFQDLTETVIDLRSKAPTHDGVWQFANGEAYYEYILHHFTSTDLSAAEIRQLGLQELERVHTEIRNVFAQIGYPSSAEIRELYDRLAEESEYVPGNEVGARYEEILNTANERIDTAFDVRPEAELSVLAGPIGDFYVSGALDGSRPGVFYASAQGGKSYYGMPTLAYHEGIPGHHFQISIAQESELPLFRNTLLFNAYAEGWALYAERLAYELDWYLDDPYGDLGRLQAEAFRAARLVVDTGIHTYGWTFDQAREFFIENVGFDAGDNVNPDFEISRYIAWPGQSTCYYIGLLKFLELRQKAMDELGEGFDLREFHNVVLSNGGMPLEILELVVDDYIQTKSAQLEIERSNFMTALANVGGEIVFSSYRAGESAIYIMQADGSHVLQVTPTNDRDSRPTWSPDGTQISYASRLGDSPNHEIYVINADGTDRMRMTQLPESFESEPAWSPDGNMLAFISNQSTQLNSYTGRYNIYLMDIASGEIWLLTPFGGSNSSPNWSPDGERILFQSTVDGNYEIYVINVDGTNLLNLTNSPTNEINPAWSPDGSQIAFVSDRDGNQEIYVMEADGSNPVRLTFHPGTDRGPAWSPNGEFIVYFGKRGFNSDIFLIRADGSYQIRLTDHGDFDGFPEWRP